MKKFLGKNLIGIIAIVLLIACGGMVSAGVKSQEPDRGDNPMFVANADVKQVFPEGKGYYLNKEKAMLYQLPEKEQKQESPVTGEDSEQYNGSTGSFSYGGGGTSGGWSVKIDTTPTLKTDLDEKNAYKDDVGSEYSFYIEPKLYDGTVPDEDDFSVTYDGKTVEGKKSGSSSFSYTITILSGTRYVKVTVKDVKRKKTLEKKYKIIGTDEQTTYKVEGSGSIDTFKDIQLSSYSVELEKGDSVVVGDIITAMLGESYSITATSDSDKKIESISGFGDSIELSDTIVKKLKKKGYEEDVDFTKSIDLTEDNGTVSTDSVFPDGSTLGGAWTIYKVVDDEETEITLTDKLKNLENDVKIVLRYEIEY